MTRAFNPYDYSAEAMENPGEVTAPSNLKPAKRPPWVKLPRAVALRLSGKAAGSAWTVYCCLLDLEFRALEKGKPLILSNKALREWGVGRMKKTRALMELENLGLVSIERGIHKAPRIRLLKV